MTDLEIARAATPRPIGAVAERLGIASDAIEPYGRYKAKLPLELLREEHIEKARLVLVTALSPTPAGEGKTTTTVGLTDGLNRIGVRAAAALREPSLGPVFGMKGGAAGGGRAQVVPMEDINLHFTGDFAAVEKANNLLSALIDNAIASTKSTLGLDPRSVVWKRVMDMNDRALRSIVTGLGGKSGGVPMEAGFNITAASEVMAILCMARDLADLNARLERIYVGDRFDRTAVTAGDLEAAGAMTLLLRDAIRPNLVQTLEHSPAFIHGGPFANIAQGTNSLLATKMAMSYADWVVTEAGFGADLGAEKFLNLKCRAGGIAPRVAVVVATVRALKYHGGVRLADLGTPDADAVRRGLPNLERHLESLAGFGLPVVVALNAFASDAPEEQAAVLDACAALGVPAALNRSWALGGEGAVDLAAAVVAAASPTPHLPAPHLRARGRFAGQNPCSSHPDLRRRRRGLGPESRHPSRPIRATRPRPPAHLHGKNPKVPHGRRVAHRPPHRLPHHRPRIRSRRRRGLPHPHHRLDAPDARPPRPPRIRRHARRPGRDGSWTGVR